MDTDNKQCSEGRGEGLEGEGKKNEAGWSGAKGEKLGYICNDDNNKKDT